MVFVFFIYGLSFFLLGLMILIYPKKGSAFKLAYYIYWIAGFGLLHGINEWLDMFVRIHSPAPILENIRMLTLPASFYCLIIFGVWVVVDVHKKASALKILPVILPLAWLAIFLFYQDFLMGDIWSRYLLCVPGTLLTGLGCYLQLRQFKHVNWPVVVGHLKIAAVVFVIYGVLAGAIVPTASFFPAAYLNYDLIQQVFGMPVQIFRAVCAVILAYCILRILEVFHWETQTALWENELRFATISNAVPIIFFMTDQDKNLVFIRGSALDSLGLQAENLLGKPLTCLIPNDDPMHDMEASGHSSILPIGNRTFEISCSPHQSDKGQTGGLIGVAIDITQRIENENELEGYRQEMLQNRRMVELGTISNSVVQKIDQPLHVARLLVERALSGIKDVSDPEMMHDILSKCFKEISATLSQLQIYHEYAELPKRDRIEPVDLYPMVKRMIAVLNESARKVHLSLHCQDMDIIPSLVMPKKELEQIFFIMMQHVIDSADSRQPQSLTMRCRQIDDHIQLLFCDTCGEIPPEQLENLFDPLQAAQGQIKGNGMGLAILHRLVGNYGGKVTVDNQNGGTIYCISLPVQNRGG